jgi:hypothetical protein
MAQPCRRLAYFDTNIFDNLLKKTGGVIESDEVRLRAAIEADRLSVLLSILNIQETLGAHHSRRPDLVLPQLQLILNLTDWDRFVKPCDVLITDDIKHFSWNGEPDQPFIREPPSNQLRSALQELQLGRRNFDELDDLIKEDRRQKEGFLQAVEEVQEETRAQIQDLKERGPIPTFQEYLTSQAAEIVARDLAQHIGPEVSRLCEQRGLAAFLRVPSVRITVGLTLSFIYRTDLEGKRPKIGASRDLQHAPPAAAAADTFVTHDTELAYLLRRVPTSGFQVLSLRELLQDLA